MLLISPSTITDTPSAANSGANPLRTLDFVMRSLRFLTFLVFSITLVACGTDAVFLPVDDTGANSDTASDGATGTDATDTGTSDVGPDGTPPPDTGPDVTPPPDVGPDGTPPPDTGPDVTPPPDIGPDGTIGCTEPNPGGCVETGCADDEVCFTQFFPGVSCRSSHCECVEESGEWMCSRDCGGGECVPEPGTVPCETDGDCTFGAQWCEEGLCVECNNDIVVCDIECGAGRPLVRNGCHPCGCAGGRGCGPSPEVGCYPDADDCDAGLHCEPSPEGLCRSSGCICDETTSMWVCLPDCAPGVCVPDDPCSDIVPPTGCYGDFDCEEGELCEILSEDACFPSECGCDPDTGEYWCTDDCAPGLCVEAWPGCPGPNPAGCVSTGCAEDEECRTFPDAPCVPSTCFCDEETGMWGCTGDCGGGVCMPTGPTPCETDLDCAWGAQWCEDGECVECDNSGLVCFIACEDGYGLAERNGCHPCECVPLSECTADDECLPWQRCEPGSECLHWCPAGDPSCCYGNRCVDLPD